MAYVEMLSGLRKRVRCLERQMQRLVTLFGAVTEGQHMREFDAIVAFLNELKQRNIGEEGEVA